MLTEYKKKLYYSISEVGNIVGVKTSTLRFWEKTFSILRPSRTNTKHRRYTHRDVEIALLIKDILHNRGMKIEGAKQIIKNSALRKKLKEHHGIDDIKKEILDIKEDVNSLLRNLESLESSFE